MSYILMMTPTLVVYAIMLVALALTVRLSLYEWDGISPQEFVGLENYLRLFKDFRFFSSLRNITILIGATVIFQVFVGILLAYFLIDMKLRFANFFKSVIFLPVVISNVAVALYFISLYDYQNGLFNHLLVFLGLDKINFLALGKFTIFFAVIPQTWQYIGLMFIIAYTGFSAVPTDYIDAAKIDGVNSFQRLIHIYLPVSWDSVSVCFIIALVGPLKAFEHIQIVTTGGGADQLSHIPATLMFYIGFDSYEYGYGCSVATFIFVLALTSVTIFRTLFKSKT